MKTWKFAIPVLVMLTLSVWSRAFFAQDETPAKAVPARPPAGQEEPARAAPATPAAEIPDITGDRRISDDRRPQPATPAAEMPDITGTWQLQESKDSFARIRKSDDDDFDYELGWPVRGQGRPSLKLKWHPKTKTFEATAPWPMEKASQGDAVYVVKATMNNSSLKVTINLGEKAQKYYEKLRDEEKANNTLLDPIWFPQMSFVKLELGDTDVAGAPAAPPKPAVADPFTATEIPDISGTWNLQEYTNGYAQIRKLDEADADFELHWLGPAGQGRPSLKLKWIAKDKEFEGTAPWPLETWAKGNAVYVVKPQHENLQFNVTITPGEEARKYYEKVAAKLKTNGAQQSQIDRLLQPVWVKHIVLVHVQFGPTDFTEPPAPPPAQKQIEGTDLLLLETDDGLSAFSKTLGTWDSITVDPPKNGEGRLRNATVGQNFAVVIIDDHLFGYSAASGRWGQMTIPEEFVGKVHPIVGFNLLSIQLGDTTYVFSPQTAKWTSPGAKGDAAATEMPDISGIWQLPEYENSKAKISQSSIRASSFSLERHWGWDKPVGDPSIELQWIADRGHFEGRSKWPLHALANGHATYVVTPNDTISVLNVEISLDESARHEFEILAEKLVADGKSREEIEQQLLHPQWHRTVSPELVKLFKGDSLGPPHLANGPNGPFKPDVDVPDTPQPLATPEMQRSQAFIAELEKRSAQTAAEIRAIVKKKLAAEPVDEAKLGELRENLKITLTEALDLKLKLEAQQAEHLESRLARLKNLMEERTLLSDQIIDRRMNELLDTDATKWDAEIAAKPKSNDQVDPRFAPRTVVASLPRAETTVEDGTKPAKYPKDKVTIDLYGGRRIHGTKALFNVVAALSKLPDVVTNTREVGEGDKVVMAIVTDPTRRTENDKNLKQSIIEALQLAGIENIRWQYNVEPVKAAKTAYPQSPPLVGLGANNDEDFFSPLSTGQKLIAAQKEVAAAKLQWDEVKTPSNTPAGRIPVEKRDAAKLRYDQSLEALRLAQAQHAALVRAVELQIEFAQRQLATAEDAAKSAESIYGAGGPGVDAEDVAEARLRRDQIELSLKRLQNRMEFLKKAANESESPSPDAEAIDAPEAGDRPAVAKAPLIDVRTTAVDDIGSRLVTARNDVEVAKLELDRLEQLAKHKVVSQEELDKSRLKYDFTVRRFEAMKATKAEMVRDLQLQIEAASLEIEPARAEFEVAQVNAKKGYVSAAQLEKISNRIIQGELKLKRLQNRMEFLKKAGSEEEHAAPFQNESSATPAIRENDPVAFYTRWFRISALQDPRRISDDRDRIELKLYGERFTDDSLKPLADFTGLESFAMCDVNVEGPGLANLGSATNLASLGLIGPKAADTWLEHLPANAQLKVLNLYGSAVTDEGMQHLRKFPNLERLDLAHTAIGDEGIGILRHLPKLKALTLTDTQVSDAGLKMLAHLPQLETFYLASPNVEGPGLVSLRECKNLKQLTFTKNNVNNEWLAAVAPIKSIEYFQLNSTQVTSEGLAHISDWTNLLFLHLHLNPIDDGAVDHLKGLYRLRSVELSGTLMTPAGIERLREALPDTDIGVNPEVKYPGAKDAGNDDVSDDAPVEAKRPVALSTEQEIDPARNKSRRQIPDAAIQQTVEAFTTARDKLAESKQELDRYEDLAERNSISTETIVASRKQYVEAENNLRLTQRSFDHVRSFISMETFVNKEKFDAAQRALENAKSKRDKGEITPEEFATFQSRYDHEEQERKRLEHQADVFRQAIAGKENIVSLSSVMETRDSKASDDSATYRDLFEMYAHDSKFDNPHLLRYLTDRWELSLVGEKFTDADLAQLAAMPRLSTLRLCDVNVSGPGLAELKRVKKLYRLDLFGPRVTDEWLVNLPKMPKLQELRLVGSSITDDGLQQIRKFHWLHHLDLQETGIGDEGMEALVHVPELKTLWLKNTEVSDEGLKYLSRVPHVAQFSLASPHVKGEGLTHLQRMNDLSNLQLTGSTADDKWMQAIAPLQHVVDLELHGTQVTSQGLAHLRGWTKLRRLYLNVNAQLDDNVIEHLQEIGTLQVVELNGTQLTPEGLVRLRQALPNARIVCDAAEAKEK